MLLIFHQENFEGTGFFKMCEKELWGYVSGIVNSIQNASWYQTFFELESYQLKIFKLHSMKSEGELVVFAWLKVRRNEDLMK